MTFQLMVRNGTVVLPPEANVKDGDVVRVVVLNSLPVDIPEQMLRAVGSSTTGLTTEEIMRFNRGDDWDKEN